MACAWEAARRGLRVCVLDAGEPGAWQVAAGMLAPVAESDFGEGALTALGIRAAESFETFCAELAEAGGGERGGSGLPGDRHADRRPRRRRRRRARAAAGVPPVRGPARGAAAAQPGPP